MSDLNLSPQEQNIVDYHNGSMSSGRVGRDEQGRPMTVYSTGILIERGPHRGKFVSVPGGVPEVNPDRPLTEREAFEHWEDEINKGTWPFYGSGTELNNRSQEMHGIMDMDADIINQNIGSDGKQPIHVTPDEAELVRRLEGGGRMSSKAEWDWSDIQTLVPTSSRMATPEMFLSNPMSTSGLAYVDKDMKPSTDMRGNRTPEHLQRNQDDIVSYTTSELARNMIEDLRMSMPRKMQDGLSGSMFVEVGRDGTHSLFTGNEKTGYTELSFAPGDQGFRSAMDTVRKGFVYADANEDFGMDAGFWGRATSAGEYQGYTSRDLNELLAQGMSEVKSYYQYDPFLAAEAMRFVDNIGDEQRRRRGGDDARALGYSRRVVEREIGRRANSMMGKGRL